jgi:hypothetical protein
MQENGNVVVGDANLTDVIMLAVENSLSNDNRIRVPNHLIKEMSFVIPLDIQIRLQSGHTVIINHEIKGELSVVPDEKINGKPVLRGVVTSRG